MQKVAEVLQREFPGSTPELEQARPLQKVGGYLIWSGFEGVEQIDRQRQLTGAIKRNLPAHEQLLVTTILTMTPQESELMRTE